MNMTMADGNQIREAQMTARKLKDRFSVDSPERKALHYADRVSQQAAKMWAKNPSTDTKEAARLALANLNAVNALFTK